jgi:nucleotide-binding universal stress UspA family protein
MFQQLVVPIDGSAASWQAIPVAARMAAAVDGKVEVVTVVDRLGDVSTAQRFLRDGIADLGPLATEPMYQVLASDSVARAIADHLDSLNGGMVVMSSHGHGRSAAVLGSVTDELLRLTFGPVVVIGPHVAPNAGELGGPYVVALDGSRRAEAILPITGAWALEFGGVPWLVEVLDSIGVPSGDVFESAYVGRVAHDFQSKIGHEVEFETLHGERPSRVVVDFADRLGATLVFLTTHGRSGLDRLRLGSVASEIVRHATCPVVLHRPPDLPA